jgi:hypothetical protein
VSWHTPDLGTLIAIPEIMTAIIRTQPYTDTTSRISTGVTDLGAWDFELGMLNIMWNPWI